jgi:hypothetical protein
VLSTRPSKYPSEARGCASRTYNVEDGNKKKVDGSIEITPKGASFASKLFFLF